MSRQINCISCSTNMGEIRDATLRKGLVVLCASCELTRLDTVRRLSDFINGKPKDYGKMGDVFGDVFGDIFGPKK